MPFNGLQPGSLLLRGCFLSLPRAALLMLCVGCGAGDELGRVEVSGEVTRDGTGIKEGRVSLTPEAGTKGPASGAAIINGKFLVQRARGPVPGKYLVRVEIAGVAGDADVNRADRRLPTKEDILAGTREAPAEAAPDSSNPVSVTREPREAMQFHIVIQPGVNRFHLPIGGTASRLN